MVLILDDNPERVARVCGNCRPNEQMPKTGQIADFTLHVHTYFWVTIFYKYHEKYGVVFEDSGNVVVLDICYNNNIIYRFNIKSLL